MPKEKLTLKIIGEELLRLLFLESPSEMKKRALISKYAPDHSYYAIFPVSGTDLHGSSLEKLSQMVLRDVQFYSEPFVRVDEKSPFWSEVLIDGARLDLNVIHDISLDVDWFICKVTFGEA